MICDLFTNIRDIIAVLQSCWVTINLHCAIELQQ